MNTQHITSLVTHIRWYHLGFAAMWALVFAGLPLPVSDGVFAPFFADVTRQICVLVGIGLMIVIKPIRDSLTSLTAKGSGPTGSAPFDFPHEHSLQGALSTLLPTLSGAFLSIGALLLYLQSFYTLPLPIGILGSIGVGLGCGIAYVSWQEFFASEGATFTYLFIPLSAIVSVPLSFMLQVLPIGLRAIFAVVLLPGCATFALNKSLSEISILDHPLSLNIERSFVFLKQEWQPILIACLLAIVWRLSMHVFKAPSSTMIGALIGMAVAIAIVMLIALIGEANMDPRRMFRLILPALAAVLMLPAVFGSAITEYFPAILLFSFEIINLQLIITCAIYASEKNLSATQIYALGVGPTLASLLGGDLLGELTSFAVSHDYQLGLNAFLICIYVLLVAMFFFGATPKPSAKSVDEISDKIDATSSCNNTTEEMPKTAPQDVLLTTQINLTPSISGDLFRHLPTTLTPREYEVLALIVSGNKTSGIARKLYISENTVRDHIKSIYKKCQVHSHQELVDLVENV